MKTKQAKIKVPKGWRELRDGETVKKGDFYIANNGEKIKCVGLVGHTVGEWSIDTTTNPYIRRIKRTK